MTVTGAIVAAPAVLALPEAQAATGSAAPAATASGTSAPSTSPLLLRQPEKLGAPPVDGLHLTFGADPTREMTASWSSVVPVGNPRVRFGTLDGGYGREVQAEVLTYIDGASNREVYTYHARMQGLNPDTSYIYAALGDGVLPDGGSFTTEIGRAHV